MIKSKFKRVTSLFLATLMCVTTFAGIGSTTAYAASGEKADVYMVDFPRDGDANYDGVWGHSNLTLKNGWHTGRSNFTNLKAIGSYSGNVAYCIEPGISLKVGQTMNKYDENYFNNLAANGVISGDEIRLFVGRILQYGYRGTISTSWRSQNEAAANSIAQAYATQLLIWETVIGERDANFNHVAASGCSNVKDVINAKHPLRNKIFSYYNSMVQSVQNHATIPSFCNKSSGSAKTIELEWNGSKYTTTLTDSNNVLSKYNFKASISGVSFSVNGNKLTVSMDTAPSKEFTITATKKNAVRRGVVVWSEGKHGQNSSVQDVVSYAQEVSDSINGYVKMKVSYGSCQIVKTSEDGKVDGINFTIKIAMDIVAKHIEPDKDGVRIAELDEMSYRRKLWNHRPLTDFWRVGKGYAKKLEEHGLFTMGDIARCSIGKSNELYNEELLYKLFGINAELLIDHAWGYEPCTMEQVKAYKPETNSVCSGQVLHCPYDYEKAKLIVKEMTDQMVLDLVDKGLVTDQLVLTIGYDIENLSNPNLKYQYKGEVTIDRYGRKVPKHAHGTANLEKKTSSTRLITNAVMDLYDRIVDEHLLVRRITITANKLVDEKSVKQEDEYQQLDLFTDYEAQRKKQAEEEEKLERERRMQEAMLSIKKKFGKNAVLKGMNLEEGATAKDRNEQIGGHKA